MNHNGFMKDKRIERRANMGKYFNNILKGRTKPIKQLFVIDISVKTMYIHLFRQTFFIEHLLI